MPLGPSVVFTRSAMAMAPTNDDCMERRGCSVTLAKGRGQRGKRSGAGQSPAGSAPLRAPSDERSLDDAGIRREKVHDADSIIVGGRGQGHGVGPGASTSCGKRGRSPGAHSPPSPAGPPHRGPGVLQSADGVGESASRGPGGRPGAWTPRSQNKGAGRSRQVRQMAIGGTHNRNNHPTKSARASADLEPGLRASLFLGKLPRAHFYA